MNYSEFLEYVRDNVAERMGEDAQVRLIKVNKNNGVELDGIVIVKGSSSISPTIYLDYFYGQYKKGQTREEIIEALCKLYQRSVDDCAVDIEKLSDYKYVKDKIAFRIVNYEKNKKMLELMPYVKYLDLAVIFYIFVDLRGEGENGSFIVKEEHLDMWGIDHAQLYKDALYNTPVLLGENIREMESVLGGTIDGISGLEMYVMSNVKGFYGAGTIMYKEALKNFADKVASDLYILPSSIHEVILLPKNSGYKVDQLKEMVRDVNENELDELEVLSDNVYVYNRKWDILEVAN